jgi:hypothetical protein
VCRTPHQISALRELLHRQKKARDGLSPNRNRDSLKSSGKASRPKTNIMVWWRISRNSGVSTGCEPWMPPSRGVHAQLHWDDPIVPLTIAPARQSDLALKVYDLAAHAKSAMAAHSPSRPPFLSMSGSWG